MKKITPIILLVVLSCVLTSCKSSREELETQLTQTLPAITSLPELSNNSDLSEEPTPSVPKWIGIDALIDTLPNENRSVLNFSDNKSHLENNQEQLSGVLNGQGIEPLSEFKYGKYTFSYNGCEVIATYNLLYIHDIKLDLAELTFEYENNALIAKDGSLGSNPTKIKLLFDKLDLDYIALESIDEINERVENSPIILSFWTGDILKSTVHTVTIEKIDGEIAVYNAYNSAETTTYYEDISEYVGRDSKLISAYQIT